MLTTKEQLLGLAKGALWGLFLCLLGFGFAELLGYLFTPETNREIARGLMYGLWGFIWGILYCFWVEQKISKKYSK